MFNIFNSFSKSKNSSLDYQKIKCNSTRLSQTQYSCPRVTDEDKLLFENSQLKYQLRQLDEELRMYKLQEKKEKFGPSFKQEKPNTGYKKMYFQCKSLEVELLQKVKEIEELKRSSSYCKFQELNIECKEYQQECQRLKKQIYQLNKLLNFKINGINLKDLYQKTEIQLKKSQVELKDSQQQQRELQGEVERLKYRIEKLELDNQHLEKENKKQLLILSQVEIPQQNKLKSRLQIYRDEIEIIRLQAQITKLEKQISDLKNNKHHQIDQLLQIIKEKDDQLQAYEQANPNGIMKEVSQTQQNLLDEKYQNCVKNIQTEPSINDDLLLQMPSQLNLFRQQSIRKKHIFEYQKSFQVDMTSINGLEEDGMESSEMEEEHAIDNELTLSQKMTRINFYEIEHIATRLRLELQLKQIPLSQLYQLLESQFSETITVKELLDVLSKAPFEIQDEKEKILIARYLIEDNSQDYVYHNLKNANQISIIKSILKQLLGKYEIFKQDEKQKIEVTLSQIFMKNQYKLIDSIQQLLLKKPNSNQAECDQSDYEAALRFCEIQLQPRQIEYLEMINYKFSKKLDKINFKELINYFKTTQFNEIIYNF